MMSIWQFFYSLGLMGYICAWLLLGMIVVSAPVIAAYGIYRMLSKREIGQQEQEEREA